MSESKNSCAICEDTFNIEEFKKQGSHDHEHGFEHEHAHGTFDSRKETILVIVALSIFVIGLFTTGLLRSYYLGIPEYIVFLTAYLLAGYTILENTARNIAKGHIFDENFLMTVASIGAIFTNNLPEAVAVMIFYKIGEILEDRSVSKSKKSIQALLDIKPPYANVIEDDCLKQIEPEKVNVGDIFLVKPGEKVPLDGIITSSSSKFDTSPLTGESIPRSISKDGEVLAGIINISNSVEIRCTKPFKDSSVSKIMNLVQNAEENKSQTAKFITKFAKYYTPVVVFSALFLAVIPPLLIPGDSFSMWVYRAMIFLVISCPCALVISVPLGYFGGIGGASKRGILVKGANFLDVISKVDAIVFDKTGTLTKGNFAVTEIVPINHMEKDKLLELTALIENYSNHPIAKSIVQAYGKEPDTSQVKDFSEIPSYGIKAIIDGKEILAGNDKILHKFKIPHDHSYCIMDGTVVHVAYGGIYEGYLMIADEIKDDAPQAIKQLKELGIKNLTILSGDEQCIVEGIAGDLQIENYYSGLLPEEKVSRLREIKRKSGVVAFVGDGINDAPVIANSDVGIVMGGLGSDAAIETADIVLMNDKLKRIPTSIRIGRKTRSIIWENIILVFIIKAIFLTLGALGFATMWEAVFADVGLALIAIFNASRILQFQSKKSLMKKQEYLQTMEKIKQN